MMVALASFARGNLEGTAKDNAKTVLGGYPGGWEMKYKFAKHL